MNRRDLPTVRLFSAKESSSKVFNPEYAELRREDVEKYVQQFLDEMTDDDEKEEGEEGEDEDDNYDDEEVIRREDL